MYQLENSSVKGVGRDVKKMAALFLALLFLGAGALVPSLLKLQTVYNLEQFLPTGDHTFADAKKIREKYQLSESPAVVVLLEQGSGETWVNKQSVNNLKKVTASLATIDKVASTISFATRPGAEMTAAQIQVGRLTDIVPETLWSTRFHNDALMTPLLLSSNQKTALIYVEMATNDIPEMKTIFGQIESTVQTTIPNIKVRLGGIPALQAGFQSALEGELFRFVGLSFFATFLIIFALFRGFGPVLISLVTVLLSNIVVLGGLQSVGYDLTVLTVTVPILVTLTVVAQLVHTFFRLHERRRSDGWRKHFDIQKDLFLPNFVANLTTAVGFATLAPSEIPMISQYGGVVAATVMISWLMATLTLPALTCLSPDPMPRDWALMKARWVLTVLKYKKSWSLGVLFVSIAASLGAFHLNWGTRLFDDLPAHHESRITTERLDQEFGGVLPLNVEVTATSESFWKEPKNLEKLDSKIEQLRATAGVGQVLSLVDFLKAFDADSKFPKNSQAISELMFLYSLSGQNPLRQFLTPDGKSLRLQVKIRDIPGDQMKILVTHIQTELRSVFTDVQVSVSGMANHLHPTNNRVSAELIFGFWQAMLAIFIILIPVFGSVRWALIACLPNLVPPALLLGIMAAMQTPIKPPLALIFSISLGLAFNNTAYVFDRLRVLHKRGRRIRLIEHVFHREGMNCLHSTMVVLAGFGVFLFAEFSVNQTFGAFMLVSIFAGLVADLVFLPALLAWMPGLLSLNAPAKASRPPTLVPQPSAAAADILLTTHFEPNADATSPRRPPMQDPESPSSNSHIAKAASILAFIFVVTGAPHAKARPTKAARSPASVTKTLAPSSAPSGAKSIAAASSGDLKTRFQKALKQFESRDEEAHIKLSIIETDGSILVRELELQRTGQKGEQRMMARILSPADLKGTSLLSIVTKDDENQWVYLPSSKQVRKVVASESSEGGVLGSELRYEDFDPSVIRETEVSLLKPTELNGKKHDVIEAVLPKGKSPYEKAQVWILIGKDLPTQIDYYNQGQKVKTIQFLDYKMVGQVIRPHKMTIKNLKNKRGTEILLTDVRINKGISAQKLSVDSLAKAW